ncbi:MAG: hypothetical protein JSW59_10125, partial [Phycisphaerales bacterium]
MKKLYKQMMIAVLMVFAFGAVAGAQEGDRRGELRGVFVKLTERQVGDQGYMGIVVRPFERDEHHVVLVPREYEELAHSARMMQEGDRLEISYMREHGQMWIDRIEVERRRAGREADPDGGRRVEMTREIYRRGPERMDERREGERRLELHRQMRREGEREHVEARREGERRIVIRREGEPMPEALREERPHREPPPQEMLEQLLRKVIARHMEHMGMELKEILGHHIGRMHEELMELRAHTEHLRREIEELRRQNEMLRMKLRERSEPRREGDRERR